MDDRFSLDDLHVDLLLLPFFQPVSHIPMELLVDMREVSITRSESCRFCHESSQVGCRRDEGGAKMRHSHMLLRLRISIGADCIVDNLRTYYRHPFVEIRRDIERVFARHHYMCDSHLDIPILKAKLVGNK